jgi:hypothetical protein
MSQNDIGQASYNTLVQWASNVTAQAKANILRKNKVATGNLYKSITFDVLPDGTVNFYYDDAGDFVESGRRKGAKFPPMSKISQWIKVKGLAQWRNKKGRYISRDAQTFLIARGISKNGIKPFPFFSDPFDEAMKSYAYILEEAMVEEIDNDLDLLLVGKF